MNPSAKTGMRAGLAVGPGQHVEYQNVERAEFPASE